MKLKMLNKKYQIALILLAIMLIISGVSYAYFAVTTNESSNPNIVTSGTMKITFTDGPEVRLDNAIPGDTLTKTFSVTNTGNVTSNYNIYLSDVINTFANQSDLVYNITSDKGVNITSDTQLPSEDDSLSTNIAIGVNETHNYTLNIKFLNKNQAQDTNQGKQFSAKINIVEYDIAQENAVKIKTSNYQNNFTTIAILDGITLSSIPKNDGTIIANDVSCTNGVIGEWDSTKWGLTLTELSDTSTTCIIHFSTEFNYDYTGSIQTFTAPKAGYYKLETWGAQGGAYNSTATGGYGAYSVGVMYFNTNDTLYITVGGKGINGALGQALNGGYNGGGNSNGFNSGGNGGVAPASGGGATSISSVSGLLSTLSSNTSAIEIVASGGGGAGGNTSVYMAAGGAGGGYIGNNGGNFYSNSTNYVGYGGSQTAGGSFSATFSSSYSGNGSFGKGSNGLASGAGGGYYGGGSSGYSSGGGSSYIANNNLISTSTITKHMTCYNCATSTTDTTKTLSNSNVSSNPTSDYSKLGNGYAVISFISASLN